MTECKPYFIGMGNWTVAKFDTLEEMVKYHKGMESMDRHFCRLYDHHDHRTAEGWEVQWAKNIDEIPWSVWD